MRVLHVLNSTSFSGAENVVCQIIGMLEDECDMIYCSPNGRISEELGQRKINYVPVGKMTIKELRKVIKDQKPDIVHAHDMKASFIAALSCRRVPLISHIHNNAFDSRGLSIKSIAFLIAGIKAKHIFWVSNSAFTGYFFRHFFKKKSSVLANVIDIDQLYQKMESDQKSYLFDVIYLGRLTYPKNPQRLMSICKRLVDRKNNIRIGIIGTGELEDEVKQLAIEYKITENVMFLGFQSNPLKMLHDSKVMLMTSRWEGTPMCALESLALGVPIVSTPVDGLKDLILQGECGYLYEDDETIADTILKVVEDQNHRAYLSRNALCRSKQVNDKCLYKKKIVNEYLSSIWVE